MKIDIRQIVYDHLHTLHGICPKRISKQDVLLFYALPFLLSCSSIWLSYTPNKEVHSVSITFYGIFIALLLNMQVAIFGIFLRVWRTPSDPRLATISADKNEEKRQLLQELNSNISYLVLISCIALFVFLIMFCIDLKDRIGTFMLILLYTHFLLTLLMIVKRMHILFKKEYS